MSRVSCILVMLVFTSGGCNQSEQAAPEAQLSRQAQSAVETSNAAWELWWHDRDVAAIQQGNQALSGAIKSWVNWGWVKELPK